MVCSICISRAPFTVESGVCFCCTDITGQSTNTDVSGYYGDLSGAACCAGRLPFGAVESPGIWVAIVNHKNLIRSKRFRAIMSLSECKTMEMGH